MLKLNGFTLERSGEVHWKVTGDTHCGPKHQLVNGAIPVRYQLMCTCNASSLDERGFLFDQAQVATWMERLANEPTSLSCERLAQYIAERFLSKVARDVPSCKPTELMFTLSPAPYMASITVHFK